MEALKLSRRVYAQIMDTLGRVSPECGGVLGAGEDGLITEFFFDATGRSTATGYTPDVAAINELLVRDWMPRGVLMVGIVHSHANGNCVPSCGDVGYGIRILQALDTVDRFYLPIVTVRGGSAELFCYAVYQDVEGRFVCRRLPYELLDEKPARG